MKSEQILQNAKKVLAEEGSLTDANEKTNSELLEEFILPGLKNSQNTLADIYFSPKNRSGLLGKLKTKIQKVIINTTINVIEKQSMKQQKFNSLTVKAIEALLEENKRLRG